MYIYDVTYISDIHQNKKIFYWFPRWKRVIGTGFMYGTIGADSLNVH